MNVRNWRLGLGAASVIVLGLARSSPVLADGPFQGAVHGPVAVSGQVYDPALQALVTVTGTADGLVVFEANGAPAGDRPSGGCVHVHIGWNGVQGSGGGSQWDGRGVTDYRFPLADLSQGQFSFSASFDLVADRPGGGCLMVNTAITLIVGSEGVVSILIGL